MNYINFHIPPGQIIIFVKIAAYVRTRGHYIRTLRTRTLRATLQSL